MGADGNQTYVINLTTLNSVVALFQMFLAIFKPGKSRSLEAVPVLFVSVTVTSRRESESEDEHVKGV